jgi:hypothetical protein
MTPRQDLALRIVILLALGFVVVGVGAVILEIQPWPVILVLYLPVNLLGVAAIIWRTEDSPWFYVPEPEEPEAETRATEPIS